MKIVNNADPEVFSSFTSAFSKFSTFLPFSLLTVRTADIRTESFSDSKAVITVPETNDKILLENMFLSSLNKLELRSKIGSMHPVIEDIIVNRRIASLYQEEIMYVFSMHLFERRKVIESMEDFLSINIPWLSLYHVDEYKWKYLRKMLENFKYEKSYEEKTKKLFPLLKKDLRINDVREKAVKELILLG